MIPMDIMGWRLFRIKKTKTADRVNVDRPRILTKSVMNHTLQSCKSTDLHDDLHAPAGGFAPFGAVGAKGAEGHDLVVDAVAAQGPAGGIGAGGRPGPNVFPNGFCGGGGGPIRVPLHFEG